MEELPVTLHGCRAMVLGYGRLGKLVAHRLHALGARVTVAARKWSDLAWAEAYGCCAEHISTLDGWLCGYDLLINTVPARVLGADRLAELRPNTLVIDLASKPGGAECGFALRPAGTQKITFSPKSHAELAGLCYNGRNAVIPARVGRFHEAGAVERLPPHADTRCGEPLPHSH